MTRHEMNQFANVYRLAPRISCLVGIPLSDIRDPNKLPSGFFLSEAAKDRWVPKSIGDCFLLFSDGLAETVGAAVILRMAIDSAKDEPDLKDNATRWTLGAPPSI